MLEIILIIVVIGADQLSKHLTDLFLMPLGTTMPLWEGVFHLTSVHNQGAAFGLMQGGRWFFLAATLLACALIGFVLIKKREHLHVLIRICLSLIFAGAIGNLIDRVLLGYVRDMMDFRLINFAVFNVADSAVVVGAILLALDILFGKGKTLLDDMENKRKQPASDGAPQSGDVLLHPEESPQKAVEQDKHEIEAPPAMQEKAAKSTGE